MFRKELTAEERLKKYGNQIIGIALFHLVSIILIKLVLWVQQSKDFASVLIDLFFVLFFLLTILGVVKRKRLGVICGWILEMLLILSAVFQFIESQQYGLIRFGISGCIETLCLPIILIEFASALSDIEKPTNEKRQKIVMPVLPLILVAFSIDCIIILKIMEWYLGTFLTNEYL